MWDISKKYAWIGKAIFRINDSMKNCWILANICGMSVILKNEGINFTINEEVKTDFIKDVATPEKNISITDVEEWLKNNTKKNWWNLT